MLKKIVKYILLFLLIVFKYHLIVIYFFIKLFTKQRSQVFLLSRQSNELSINYKELISTLKKENISYKIICKKVPDGLNSLLRNEGTKKYVSKELLNIINYYFNLYKQMYYIAVSKVIIIDGYNLTTSILKHKKDTLIIQMWHALGAIKKFGYQTINKNGVNPKIAKILCMHENYNYVLGGSNKTNEFFAKAFNISKDKILNIGTPLVEYLKNNNVDNLLKDYPNLSKKTNILYAPTFRNNKENSINKVINTIDLNKYNLIISCHPKDIKVINNKNIIITNNTKYSTLDFLKVSDYVITDYSAIAIEALVLNKKILFYVYDYDKYEKECGINVDLFKEIKGNVSKDFKDIYTIIEDNNYNINSYNSFKKSYLPNIKVNSLKELMKIIKEHL